MTDAPDHFDTAIRDIHGVWPQAPPLWSYSSLRDAEVCPRRWMLSRATYPGIWDKPGFPHRPLVAALAGDVVHNALELLLRELHSRGCSSIRDEDAATAIREFGGFSRIVESQIDRDLKKLEENPRAAPLLEWLRRELSNRIPDLRHRVQSLMSRATLMGGAPRDAPSAPGGGGRGALGPGSYPEVTLAARDLRFKGRADLLTVDADGCVVTDYKTGAADEGHAEQVRSYALLWDRDKDRNPAGIPVRQLVIAYPSHDQLIDAPAPQELDALADAISARIVEADRLLADRPPSARPAPDVCRLCSVRPICDDYWASPAAIVSTLAPHGGEFTDIEGTVTGRHGPRSWFVSESPSAPNTLLRTPTEQAPFSTGERIRILHVRRTSDDETDAPILVMTQTSEVFVVRES